MARIIHTKDERLRRFGFVIRDRPRKGEAVWTLNCVPYTESEALWLVDKELKDLEGTAKKHR